VLASSPPRAAFPMSTGAAEAGMKDEGVCETKDEGVCETIKDEGVCETCET
jgi:hypothetical protein